MTTLLRNLSLRIVALVFAVPSVAQIQGYVDVVTPFHVSGWACNPTDGDAVWVHFYDGNEYLGSTTSNRIRRTDVGLCSGNFWVGWGWALPQLTPGFHSIRSYSSTSATPSMSNQLPGPTSLFVPSSSFTGPSPFGVIESMTPSQVTGWAADPDAQVPLQLDVLIQYDGQGDLDLLTTGTTGIPRSDVPYASNAGFSVALPPVPGGSHNLVVRARNVGVGADNFLEEFHSPTYSVPAMLDFPFTPSFNPDPGLNQGTSCWIGPPP